MAQLTWRHHTLVQALLSRGSLKDEELHKIFTGITGKDPVVHHQLFNDFIFKINKELAYVKFELRGCRNQYDGKIYYGVVNNVADEHSKLGSKYSVPQIAYYKAVIEAIVQDIAAEGLITNIDALNVKLENQVQVEHGSEESQARTPAAFKNFSISQKEKTLNDLIRDQWICSTLDGKIGLGVRSFLDLRSWFRSNEVPSCDVCNEAGVKATSCPGEGCSVRIHEYCLKKKFSQRKVARVCPGCGTPWGHLLPEDHYEHDGEANENTQGTNRNNNSNEVRRVKAEAVEAENNNGRVARNKRRICKTEAVDEENSSAASHFPRRSRRQRRS